MKRFFSLEERLALERELTEEMSAQVEKVETCVTKCIDTISQTHDYFESRRLVTPAMREIFQEQISLMLRTKDILEQRIRVELSYSAETDFGKKAFELSEEKIQPRWHGESLTTADLSVTYGNKVILVQDKATASNAYTIEKKDLIKVLSDSIVYRWYPVLAVSFKDESGFQHFVIPIEELVSLTKRGSVSISKSRLESAKINFLTLEKFVKRLLDCSFPVMKFEENQLRVWLERLSE